MIIVTQVSINALLAFGVTFVIITGGIDLSIGSMVAVTGVVAASFAHPDTYPVVVPLAHRAAGRVALRGVQRLRHYPSNVPPFIVTLGTMTIGRGLALILSKGRPISNLSDSFNFIGGGKLLGVPTLIIILILAFIVCSVLLKKTVIGSVYVRRGGKRTGRQGIGHFSQ